MKFKWFIVAFLFWTVFGTGLAFAITPDVTISNTVALAMKNAAQTSVLPMALTWLGAFMSLQFLITNISLLKSGADTDAILGKVAMSLVWFSVCVYVVQNAPDWLDSVGTDILSRFGPNLTSGAIISATVGLCTALITGVAALGTSIAGVGNTPLAMILVYALIAMFAAGMYVAIKVFMLSLELGLIVMLAPLSFSFLGLNALKDQGIAPFKSLLALLYRIILVGIICSSFGQIIDNASTAISALDWTALSSLATALKIVLESIVAFPVLVYLLYKSDSIASSLSSGTATMGAGDLAGAVKAGVAGGMAVAAAGQAAKAGVTSMSDFMKNMMGPGGVSNAGATGSGGAPGAAIPDPSGLPSLSDGPSAMSLDDVRKAEQADKAQSVGGGSAQGGGAGAGGSMTGGGSGAASSVKAGSAAFSQADGAKAAATVSGGQNAKNAAAVGAAMRASGAPETMAALAENIVADGGSAQGVANACGTTPAQNAAVAAAFAGAAEVGASSGGANLPVAGAATGGGGAVSAGANAGQPVSGEAASAGGEPAWLESGSAVSPGGSGANAGIAGEGQQKAPSFSDHMKNLGGRLDELGKHLEKESASTHVSISTHHQD